MRLGQYVAVDDQVAQDAVPGGIAIARLAKLSIATFKAHFDVHVVDDFQGLSDGVVAERCHVEQDHIETTDLGGLGNTHVVGWEIVVFAENAHVLAQFGQPDRCAFLHSGGRQQVDVVQGLASLFFDLNIDRGSFRDGNVSVFKWQVRQAFGKGAETTIHDDFMSLHFSMADIGDADFRDGIMQREPRCGAAFDTEALRSIGAEAIRLLRVRNADGKENV